MDLDSTLCSICREPAQKDVKLTACCGSFLHHKCSIVKTPSDLPNCPLCRDTKNYQYSYSHPRLQRLIQAILNQTPPQNISCDHCYRPLQGQVLASANGDNIIDHLIHIDCVEECEKCARGTLIDNITGNLVQLYLNNSTPQDLQEKLDRESDVFRSLKEITQWIPKISNTEIETERCIIKQDKESLPCYTNQIHQYLCSHLETKFDLKIKNAYDDLKSLTLPDDLETQKFIETFAYVSLMQNSLFEGEAETKDILLSLIPNNSWLKDLIYLRESYSSADYEGVCKHWDNLMLHVPDPSKVGPQDQICLYFRLSSVISQVLLAHLKLENFARVRSLIYRFYPIAFQEKREEFLVINEGLANTNYFIPNTL